MITLFKKKIMPLLLHEIFLDSCVKLHSNVSAPLNCSLNSFILTWFSVCCTMPVSNVRDVETLDYVHYITTLSCMHYSFIV